MADKTIPQLPRLDEAPAPEDLIIVQDVSDGANGTTKAVTRSDFGGGVQSVTGDGVDNTDPANPVISWPDPSDIGAYPDTNPSGYVDAAGAAAAAPIQSVTGDGVGGTAADVVLTFPTAGEIGAIPTSEKGAANGVATLGADGVVPYGQQDMTPWPSRTNNADSWYGPRFVTGTSNITLASGAVWSSPVEVPVDMVIDRLSLYVNTGGAGSSVEIALYTYSPNASDPITLIASAGLADTSTLGAKEAVFGTPVNVAKGIYRIAVMWNGVGSAPILRSFLGNNSLGGASANAYHFANSMQSLRTGQVFPLAATIDRTDSVNQMPTVAYRGTPQ